MEALRIAIEEAYAKYTSANPKSRAAHEQAARYLPGGNTRAVLYFEPFPLTMVKGHGAEQVDLDGHHYVDFVGEYSAGLFGHTPEAIHASVTNALEAGLVMGAPNEDERTLAKLLCDRFPSLDLVRFCNSGTEANLMALATARAATGRNKIVVFRDSYHGGVIKFPGGPFKLNAPFDFVIADFNDVDGTARAIDEAGNDLAAVLIEPVLGAGGNIPGTLEFHTMLRERTKSLGALLIYDEVKTSRIGPAGIQGLLGITPDLTTLGKYIAGGLPIGAFGGRADLMSNYDPSRPGYWDHAGTFNNDVCSMAAGCAALGEIYTPGKAAEFFDWSEAFRVSLNEMFARMNVPMHANGIASMIAIHFAEEPTCAPSEITAGCKALRPLLHMHMLHDGVLICKRGDLFLSLPMGDEHLLRARKALEQFAEQYKPLIEQVLATNLPR